MPTFPVDTDPEQIVRWLLAGREAALSAIRVSVRRAAEMREIPVRKEFHLGDEERENLSEVATVATLEIAPAHANEGWHLTIVAEDEAGPRVPDRGPTPAGEEEIDLKKFYREFILPGRGAATVVAEVQNAAGEAHLARLLDVIEKYQRGPHRGR
jgi:hypothetical protein